MKLKRAIITLIIIFVVASVAYVVASEVLKNPLDEKTSLAATGDVSGNGSKSSESTSDNPQVIIYLFHGSSRCNSCVIIEEFITKALDQGFQQALEAGELVFMPTNADDPKNRHFINDYGLTSISVVVSEMKDGSETRWKNLQLVWDLLRNERDFIEYIQSEVGDYLGAETR